MANPSSSQYEFVILIPYRNRRKHLQTFVPHMERFLSRQSFKIVVIEQEAKTPFNRGKLLNCGATLCAGEADTLIFHDVDSLPKGVNCYRQVSAPTHMSARISKFNNKFPYPEFVGCVFAIPENDFKAANGFSTEYWGWGREDDEFYNRMSMSGLTLDHVCGEYESLPHRDSPLGQLALIRWNTFKMRRYNWREDGLNNLSFKLRRKQRLRDYLDADIGEHHLLYQVNLLYKRSIIYKQQLEPARKQTLEALSGRWYQAGGDDVGANRNWALSVQREELVFNRTAPDNDLFEVYRMTMNHGTLDGYRTFPTGVPGGVPYHALVSADNQEITIFRMPPGEGKQIKTVLRRQP
jgi:hypothetical protein